MITALSKYDVKSRVASMNKIILQVSIFIFFLALGYLIQSVTHLPLSAAVIGLLLLLLCLLLGAVKLEWIKHGSDFILSELVLFFIPCVVGIIQFKALLITAGWQLFLSVFLGTICVMFFTAYSVHWGFKLERKIQLVKRLNAQQQGRS